MEGLLRIVKVESAKQTADIFTKPLARPLFLQHIASFGLTFQQSEHISLSRIMGATCVILLLPVRINCTRISDATIIVRFLPLPVRSHSFSHTF